MGLDMFFEKSGKRYSTKNCETIYQYRKHADLHGWLRDYWLAHRAKPGADPADFNYGKRLKITLELLTELQAYVDGVPDKDKRHYTGFFWGTSDAEDWALTRVMLPDLVHRIKSGEHIYYQSSW